MHTDDTAQHEGTAGIDEEALGAFVGRLATEVAGAWGVVSIHVGVRLGCTGRWSAHPPTPPSSPTAPARTSGSSRSG